MQIKQLQVSAEPLEDRLLLRISTTAQEEIRVFFTRRFLRELWPALMGMLFSHLTAATTEPAERVSPEDAPSFDKPYQNDDPIFPLGTAPLLPAELTLTPAGPGQCTVLLLEHKQRSISVNLNSELFQALCSMLRAASEQAGWDLSLDYAAPQQAPLAEDKAPPQVPAKNRLH